MKNSYVKGTLAGVAVLITTGVLIFLSQESFLVNKIVQNQPQTRRITKIAIGEIVIDVEIADSASELVRGLSGRENLAENSGMYFVLGVRKITSFWMKDMKFSIDIIWINEGKIIGFVENVPLPTEGNIPTFTSPTPVTHVLEVNAGFIQKHSLAKSQKVREIK